MKEVYRSFEPPLSFENQRGYVIYELENMYEIRLYSVWGDEQTGLFRTRKSRLPQEDFGNYDKISELEFWTDCGAYDDPYMQVRHKGKWYSGETINKIMEANNCRETLTYWRRYA